MAQERGTPILRADGASLDWASARYSVDVKFRGYQATAAHALHDAPQLEVLVDQDLARWALELRCPKTLLARTTRDSQPTVTARWSADEVDGELFVMPGLVAVRPLYLSTDGLNPIWGDEPVQVPVGRWLARGPVLRARSLAASLLTFEIKDGLRDGEMEVTPDTSSGDLRFKVWLSPSYHQYVSTCEPRDVQIAALIAVMGRIPFIDPGDDGGDGYPILTQIRERLEDEGVPIWGDEANSEFDPARAATAIEAFQIPAMSGDDE